MTDREKLLVAVLSQDDDDQPGVPAVELTTLDVMAMLFEIGAELRAGRRPALVGATC